MLGWHLPVPSGLQVTVELKNDLAIQGTLHSVDQYLNIKLHNTRVVNEQKYPHMVWKLHTAVRQPFPSAVVKTVCWCRCQSETASSGAQSSDMFR